MSVYNKVERTVTEDNTICKWSGYSGNTVYERNNGNMIRTWFVIFFSSLCPHMFSTYSCA